eukprot:SAG25_NODE_674_length_5997_cov_8.203084_2_plen_150_part_00
MIAVFWGRSPQGANGSPVTINVPDRPEFTQYRNVVFDLSPPGRSTGVEIKLRVNGKCLTAPSRLPGQVVLDTCNSSKGQQWSLHAVDTSMHDTNQSFSLSSGLGGCAVIGSATKTAAKLKNDASGADDRASATTATPKPPHATKDRRYW